MKNKHDPIAFALSSTLLHFVTPNGGGGKETGGRWKGRNYPIAFRSREKWDERRCQERRGNTKPMNGLGDKHDQTSGRNPWGHVTGHASGMEQRNNGVNESFHWT